MIIWWNVNGRIAMEIAWIVWEVGNIFKVDFLAAWEIGWDEPAIIRYGTLSMRFERHIIHGSERISGHINSKVIAKQWNFLRGLLWLVRLKLEFILCVGLDIMPLFCLASPHQLLLSSILCSCQKEMSWLRQWIKLCIELTLQRASRPQWAVN